MSEQLNIVIASLKASREASLASIKSIDAVLAMLTQQKVTQEPEKETQDEKSCNHRQAISFATKGGSYRVCECGYQEQE